MKICRRTRTVAGNAYPTLEVADYTRGRRKTRSLANQQAARKEAERIARLLAGSDAVAATYGRYLELLRGVSASPELAFARYAEAVGTQYLHRQFAPYRTQVRRKLAAYERHIQIGLVVQGMLQYLAVLHQRAVWRGFGSWPRTANRAAGPSE